MEKTRVLFVCIHNSARSQMAEAFLNHYGNRKFHAESAGIESGRLNPLVVDVMKESGIDISNNRTKTVDELLSQQKEFDIVITVCDETSAERCPVFPGKGKKMHWGFPDPSVLTGTDEEKKTVIRDIRDKIKARILLFISA